MSGRRPAAAALHGAPAAEHPPSPAPPPRCRPTGPHPVTTHRHNRYACHKSVLQQESDCSSIGHFGSLNSLNSQLCLAERDASDFDEIVNEVIRSIPAATQAKLQSEAFHNNRSSHPEVAAVSPQRWVVGLKNLWAELEAGPRKCWAAKGPVVLGLPCCCSAFERSR